MQDTKLNRDCVLQLFTSMPHKQAHRNAHKDTDTQVQTHTCQKPDTYTSIGRHSDTQTDTAQVAKAVLCTMSCSCWPAGALETALAILGTLASKAPDATPMSCMSAVMVFMFSKLVCARPLCSGLAAFSAFLPACYSHCASALLVHLYNVPNAYCP